MSTYKPDQPGDDAPANPYARFIPREELGNFSAWHPQTFESPTLSPEAEQSGVRKPTLAERAAAELRPTLKSSSSAAASPKTEAPRVKATDPAVPASPRVPQWRPIIGGMPGQAEAEAAAYAKALEEAAAREAEKAAKAAEPQVDVDALVEEARHSGYQDGYRNGLAALEAFKQQQAEQTAQYMSEHVGGIVNVLQERFDALEQQLAGRVAGVALELARQVVRSELINRPELVVQVAEDALGALLTTARQVVIRLHPDDQAMVEAGLAEVLKARGARVVADPGLARGGCAVDSDLAMVDATLATRWEKAAASMGHHAPWNDGRESAVPTAIVDELHSDGDA